MNKLFILVEDEVVERKTNSRIKVLVDVTNSFTFFFKKTDPFSLASRQRTDQLMVFLSPH